MKYCAYCGKEIEEQRIYCSVSCMAKGRPRRKHSEETKEKIRKSNTGKSYKATRRAENIGESNSYGELPTDWKVILTEAIEEYWWVNNMDVLCNFHLNLKTLKGKPITKANLTKVQELKRELRKETQRTFYDLRVQKFSKALMEDFEKDIKSMKTLSPNLRKAEYEEKYGIKWRSKSFDRLLRDLGIFEHSVWIYEDDTVSKPEFFVWNILDKYNFSYEREVCIFENRWRVDFVVEKTRVIEVQGTYWHADRRVYEEKDLNTLQKRKRKSDKMKRTYLLSKGYTLMEVWEKDIYDSPEKVEKDIYNYCIGEGNANTNRELL